MSLALLPRGQVGLPKVKEEDGVGPQPVLDLPEAPHAVEVHGVAVAHAHRVAHNFLKVGDVEDEDVGAGGSEDGIWVGEAQALKF